MQLNGNESFDPTSQLLLDKYNTQWPGNLPCYAALIYYNIFIMETSTAADGIISTMFRALKYSIACGCPTNIAFN